MYTHTHTHTHTHAHNQAYDVDVLSWRAASRTDTVAERPESNFHTRRGLLSVPVVSAAVSVCVLALGGLRWRTGFGGGTGRRTAEASAYSGPCSAASGAGAFLGDNTTSDRLRARNASF